MISSFTHKKPCCTFLDKKMTDQLRGLAILIVVVGHLGIHILKYRYQFFNLADYGVSIFFILSGFGLARSYSNKNFKISEYLWKRMLRVMIPYCLITLLIIPMDVLFLNKSYSVLTSILTFFGINLNNTARHIDHVRWFVTLLIIWYVIFGMLWGKFKNGRFVTALFIIATGLFLFSYYVHYIGYAFLSFPFGVLIGLYFEEINYGLKTVNKTLLLGIAFILLVVCYLLGKKILPQLFHHFPDVGLLYANEFIYIIFTIAFFIVGNQYLKKRSYFLSFVGKYSYEVFLIHGILMIKYDFILFRGPLIITFWVALLVVISISAMMNRFLFIKAQNALKH